MSPNRDGAVPGDRGGRAPIRTFAELRDLLRGKDAFDALQALLEGDPLGLRERCRKWLHAEARLLDPGQLARRSLVQVANRLEALEGNTDLEQWLSPCIEAAAWASLLEEEDAAQRGDLLSEPVEPRYLFFQRSLGIEPAGSRKACCTFNGLPDLERRAAYAMLVTKEGFSLFAESQGIGYAAAKDVMMRAIAKIMAAGKVDDHG